MENILLGVEPVRCGLLDCARDARRRRRRRWRSSGTTTSRPTRRRRRSRSPQQQLVEIARALAVGCRVLVLDEPTSSLGRADVERLFALLRRLKAQGHAIVYISHFLEEVKAITDRFTVLRDGRNAGGGATADATPRRDRRADGRARAGGSLPARRRGTPGERAARGGRRSSRASRRSRCTAARSSASPAWSAPGRTRLLRALFGLEPVTQRHASASASSAGGRARDRAVAGSAGMGLLSEDRKSEGLALGLSVADNLTLSRLEPFGPVGARHAGAADAGRRARGSRAWRSSAPAPPRRSASSRAATSRRSRSRACSITTSTSSCSTSRRAASTSASKAQIYRLIDELAPSAGGRGGAQGRADGQQLPARAARPVRPHRGHAARPPAAGAVRRRASPSTS